MQFPRCAGTVAVKDASDAEPGCTVEILLEIVDHHRTLGLDTEAVTSDPVDPAGGLTDTDL